MSDRPAFRLFERFGVELEYMIVDARSLDVLPVTDRVLLAVAGEYLSEIELGAISWSNELALHVIELKTTDPAASLDGLAAEFQEHVRRINEILDPLGGRLMPTAMHPWMDPHREMRLWPHDFSPIYEAFDRVFDCRGHGWANLQSVHLNLPFADDDEFARLHAAIRLLLPIMPALAASSPVMDGKATGRLDNRLDVYRQNARRVPRVSGSVIPEPVYSKRAYEQEILQPLYRDITPLDPDGTLQHEWLNARGAIARFDRNTIEIRVLDVQECPRADLAVCRLLTGVLQSMCRERWMPLARQQAFDTEPLRAILLDAIGTAENTRIGNSEYAAAFGFDLPAEGSCTAGQLWQHLYRQLSADAPFPDQLDAALRTVFETGTLATRIARALDDQQPGAMADCYRRLCDCLAEDRMFPLDDLQGEGASPMPLRTGK
jgi:glutamate---cysteine ligase / carboxylate-amine ligase